MANVRLLELRNTYKWGGGPDKTILLSAERHDPKRVEVVVVYVRDFSDHEFLISGKAKAKGLTFYEIEEHGKFDHRVLSTLAKIVLQHDINLIHSHDYKSDLFAFLLRWKLRHRSPALVSTMHGWALPGLRGRLFWHLNLLLMRHFDQIIAVSQATKTEMVASGLPQDLITVIYNGIDTKTWSRRQITPAMKANLGLVGAFPIVGYVGRISPEKDLETWLRAAAMVTQKYPAAQFVLVGDGRDNELVNQLKNLAHTCGIADKIHFLGYREDLPSLYARFDLFLSSSRREGICNSLLEAMAMETAIVTTAAGGTIELVVDRDTGYMVSEGDVEGMARAISVVIGDSKLRDHLVRNARERVESSFSFDLRLRNIETLYESIIARRAQPDSTS